MVKSRYCGVWLAPLILVVLVALTYSNTFSCAFLFDDMSRIVSNPAIRHVVTSLVGTARPLTMLTFWFNYVTGGYNPADYHLTNLIIHAGAALLLYGLLCATWRLLTGRSSHRTTDSILLFFIAAAWALHPLQTESVTYVVQRAESLMGLFYMATLYAFARAQRSPVPNRWLMVSVVACALGMAAKPVMVTAPLMVWFYDRAFVARLPGSGMRDRKTYYALLASTWVIPLCLILATQDSLDSAGFSANMLSPMRYLITQASVVVHYLKIALWPRSLCIDYGWPAATTFWASLPSVLFMVCVCGVTVWLWRRRRTLAFALTWFLLTLIPTSSFIPIADCAAEHRMYLPLAGVLATVGMLIWPLIERLSVRFDRRHIGAWCMVGVVLMALAGRTYVRNRDYRTERTLWQSVVDLYPSHDRAVLNLSRALMKEGAREESVALCRQVIAKHDALREWSRKQIEAKSAGDGGVRFLFDRIHYASAHQHIGLTCMGEGRFADAERHFLESCRVAPGEVGCRHDLALLRIRQNRFDQALQLWKEVLAVNASDARAHTWVGLLLLRKDDEAAARQHFEAALKINPGIVPARHMLVWILATSPSSALRDGARAVRLGASLNRMMQGRHAAVLDALAAAYAETGDFEHAEALLTAALERMDSGGHPDPVLRKAIKAHRHLYRQRIPLRKGWPEITPALLNDLV